MPTPRVLVTGASGFIGSHVILELLKSGKFKVRGTVRSTNSASAAHLKEHPGLKDVELVEAELLTDDGWDAAMKDCDYVMHVASPFPIGAVTEGSLVKPAVVRPEAATERTPVSGLELKVRRMEPGSPLAGWLTLRRHLCQQRAAGSAFLRRPSPPTRDRRIL